MAQWANSEQKHDNHIIVVVIIIIIINVTISILIITISVVCVHSQTLDIFSYLFEVTLSPRLAECRWENYDIGLKHVQKTSCSISFTTKQLNTLEKLEIKIGTASFFLLLNENFFNSFLHTRWDLSLTTLWCHHMVWAKQKKKRNTTTTKITTLGNGNEALWGELDYWCGTTQTNLKTIITLKTETSGLTRDCAGQSPLWGRSMCVEWLNE